MRDAAEAFAKRCEDASHSKALGAKFIFTPAPFRKRFGSAHASSRRFWEQPFRCVLANSSDISIEFVDKSMPLQKQVDVFRQLSTNAFCSCDLFNARPAETIHGPKPLQ